MDQSSDFSRTYGGLTKWEEIKSTVQKLSSKRGGKSETRAISLDVLVGGSLSPDTFDNTSYVDFRNDWGGIQFDYSTFQKRLERKMDFNDGDLGALVDTSKWEGSGHAWDDEAIDLFRSFFVLPSPAVYLDTSGRKVNFTDFDGHEEYDFLFGLNPQSTFFMMIFQEIMFIF